MAECGCENPVHKKRRDPEKQDGPFWKNGLDLHSEHVQPQPEKRDSQSGVILPPTWRVADFTLIFQIPDSAAPNAPVEGGSHKPGFISLKTGETANVHGDDSVRWRRGRDTGIRKIFFDEFDEEEENKVWVFDHNPEEYFPDPFRGAVGASFARAKEEGDQPKERECGFYHLTFEQPQDSKSDAYTVSLDFETVIRKDKSGTLVQSNSKVFLRGVELAQFHDPLSDDVDIFTRFLILHVTGEYLTNDGLYRLSTALHRPRNTVAIPNFKCPECHETVENKFSPLLYFTKIATDELNKAMPDGREFKFEMTRLGVLQTIGVGNRKESSYPEAARPFRLVSAVPLDNAPELTRRQQQGLGGFDLARILPTWDGSAEGFHDIWAWELATGADKHTRGIKSLASIRENTSLHRFSHWRPYVSDRGAAFVRIADSPRDYDFAFNRFAATLYTDIAMLCLRAGRALSVLNSEVDDLAGIADEKGNQDSVDETVLKDKLEDLSRIQISFANFRSKLWFTSIRRKTDAEAFLQDLNANLGNDVAYKEFVDALSIQQEIITILNHRIETKRKEAVQSSRERQSLLLGVIGTLLGIASLVEFVNLPSNLMDIFSPEARQGYFADTLSAISTIFILVFASVLLLMLFYRYVCLPIKRAREQREWYQNRKSRKKKR